MKHAPSLYLVNLNFEVYVYV